MGFMDKMKAANGMNFGTIESPDFPNGVLVLKDKQLTIINAAINGPDFERVVKQSDIRIFKLIGCGGMWAKYYLEFKDGKSGVVTQEVITQSQKQGTTVTMAPIERLLKFVDPAINGQINCQPAPVSNVSMPATSKNEFEAAAIDDVKDDEAKESNELDFEQQEEVSNNENEDFDDELVQEEEEENEDNSTPSDEIESADEETQNSNKVSTRFFVLIIALVAIAISIVLILHSIGMV